MLNTSEEARVPHPGFFIEKIMSLYEIIERILFGKQERAIIETERQRIRRIRKRIRKIEREKPNELIYGDREELTKYFTEKGYDIETIGIGMKILWK